MIEKAKPLPAMPIEMVVTGTGIFRFSVSITFELASHCYHSKQASVTTYKD